MKDIILFAIILALIMLVAVMFYTDGKSTEDKQHRFADSLDCDFFPVAGYVETIYVNAATVYVENPNATIIIITPEGQYIVKSIRCNEYE